MSQEGDRVPLIIYGIRERLGVTDLLLLFCFKEEMKGIDLTSYHSPMGSESSTTWAFLLFLSHSKISHPRAFVFVVPVLGTLCSNLYMIGPFLLPRTQLNYHFFLFKIGFPFTYRLQSLRNLNTCKSHKKQVKTSKQKCQLGTTQSPSTVEWENCGIFIQ